MKQSGYTMPEITVALTLLALGSAMLWYSVRSAGRADMQNRVRQAALAAAESDLEGLHGLDKRDIRDTSFEVPAPGQAKLRLERTVFDSAKIVEALGEIILDEHLSPLEMRKPLEVRVRVFRIKAESDGLEEDNPFAFGGEESGSDSARPVISLTAKLPEYAWY